jgi:hypothetical protein
MSGEAWRPIEGYEGLYEVSSKGRVRSIARVTTRLHRGKIVTQTIVERILKATVLKIGYEAVGLSKEGRVSTKYVHELVAGAFIGPRPPRHHICHCDGIGTHNSLENLRYDLPTGNAADRRLHGTDAVGENNPRCVYTNEQVALLKSQMGSKSNAELSRMYGIPRTTISSIRTGRNWSHIE